MKKTDLILIGVVVLIVIISIFCLKETKATPIEKYSLTGTPGLTSITYEEYDELIKKEEPFIVIIERTGCHYCELYMPIAEEVAKEKNVAIYYINTDTLTEEQMTALSTSNEYLSSKEWGTPTTLLLKGTKALDSIGGYVEANKLKEFLEKNINME